jgi:hypothetical protein
MSLKKCTTLFLALLMLVSNAGLAFNVHYCGGEIAAVSSVFSLEGICKIPEIPAEKVCCTKKVVVEHKKCCKDKLVNLQHRSEQNIVKAFSFQSNTAFIIPIWQPLVFTQTSSFKSAAVADYYCDAHAPPLYRLYSQYIFYA